MLIPSPPPQQRAHYCRRLGALAAHVGAEHHRRPFDGARGGVNDDYASAPDQPHLVSTVTGKPYNPNNWEEATVFAPDGHCDYYGSKGFLSPDTSLRDALLRIPVSELAEAAVPPVCRSDAETPPGLWTRGLGAA